MSWEDAINAAKNDQFFDLSKLKPEDATKLFESKIDPKKLDEAIEGLKVAIATNQSNAAKLTTIVSVLQTIVRVGAILV